MNPMDNVDFESKKVEKVRPGHADLVGCLKYDFEDARNVLERSSARETASKVAVGAICKQVLKNFNIDFTSHVIQIGSIKDNNIYKFDYIKENVDKSQVRCVNKEIESQIIKEIDKRINDFVKKHDGFYRRYSDDFIIILPTRNKTFDHMNHIIKLFNDYHDEGLLKLQPNKTQIFKLDGQGNLDNIGHLFEPRLNELKHNINFLGFSFNGKHVTLRGKTISKYNYRKRHKAIGIAYHYTKEKGFQGSDKLYMLYSERGEHGKGNFLTYVHRVKKEFPDDPVDAPIKNNMVKIRRTLKKYQAKNK